MGGSLKDLSEINFPLQDLARRKQQTTLTILGLAIITATTIFLGLFGGAIHLELTNISQVGQLSSGFYEIFSQFIFVVSLINFLISPILIAFLVHLTMSTRIQDIGIMKTSGCLTKSVFAYFLTELSLIVLVSTGVGVFFGIIFYYVATNLLNFVGFTLSQTLDIPLITVISLILIVVSHVFGALPIRKAAKTKPVDAMSFTHNQESYASVGQKLPLNLGFSFKIATRTLLRRQSSNLNVIFCLVSVLTLITVTVSGGLVACNTSSNYVERAIGNDIILVGHQTITDVYSRWVSNFYEANSEEEKAVNYFDSAFLISQELIDNVGQIQGVINVDSRLVVKGSVKECLGVVLDPVEQSKAIFIGGNRTDTAVILGVNPEELVNDWLFFGEKLDINYPNAVIIGDSLDSTMFGDSQKQRIQLFEDNDLFYDIAGVCIDPLYNGKVVYVPLETLSEDLEVHDCNLLLLRVNPSEKSDVLVALENITMLEDLRVVELNLILESSKIFLNNIWSLVMFLPILTLLTTVIALFSFLTLTISDQRRDFSIMWASGTKRKRIITIAFVQILLIILVSSTIGISLGLLVTFTILIPEAVVAQSTVFSVSLSLIILLTVLCASSMYPIMKNTKFFIR